MASNGNNWALNLGLACSEITGEVVGSWSDMGELPGQGLASPGAGVQVPWVPWQMVAMTTLQPSHVSETLQMRMLVLAAAWTCSPLPSRNGNPHLSTHGSGREKALAEGSVLSPRKRCLP